MKALQQDATALEELSRQLFLESVDLHNEQVTGEQPLQISKRSISLYR